MGNIIDISDGGLLVATDLQGNWTDYAKVRARHADLRAQGKAKRLVIAGDLIHADPGSEDRSTDILDDLIASPDPDVIALLGNHELTHIYHFSVSFRNHPFVDEFEEKIEKSRAKYVDFMKQMKYAIRTSSGVIINHAGANPALAGYHRREYEPMAGLDHFAFMDSLDHNDVLKNITQMTREILEKQYRHPLAPDFFDDYTPQIGAVFSATAIGQYLWDVFFTGNELQYGQEQYRAFLDGFLNTMSKDLPQKFLVSGHINALEGYQVVGGRQLRIGTSHGTPDEYKVMGFVQAERDYQDIEEIVQDLVPLNR